MIRQCADHLLVVNDNKDVKIKIQSEYVCLFVQARRLENKEDIVRSKPSKFDHSYIREQN